MASSHPTKLIRILESQPQIITTQENTSSTPSNQQLHCSTVMNYKLSITIVHVITTFMPALDNGLVPSLA